MHPQVIEKYYKFIVKDKITDCWNWTGFLDKKGSPVIRNGPRDSWKEYSVRRVSLRIHKNIVDNKLTLSTCKNKLCVNPEHLIYGDEARFLSKIQKLNNGCWVWIGSEHKGGYGKFSYVLNGTPTTTRAHRYSFMLKYGFMPSPTSLICHTCDNPRCVNPEHLFMGSNQDNSDDKLKKNRQSSKLNNAQFLKIRQLYAQGTVPVELAKLFHMTSKTIYDVIRRRTWKHI